MDKKLFWKEEVPKKVKDQILQGVGAAFIRSGYEVLIAITYAKCVNSVEAGIMILLGILIQVKKSRAASIIATSIFAVSQIYQVLNEEPMRGQMIMALGFAICFANGIVGTLRYHKLLKNSGNA